VAQQSEVAVPAGGPKVQKSPEQMEEVRKKLAVLTKRFADVTAANGACAVKSVHIVHRHRFSSKLQRMSVVCDVAGQNGGMTGGCCLVKGSPEAIGASASFLSIRRSHKLSE
jgi:magnesium-transporting ATPase (P-type)